MNALRLQRFPAVTVLLVMSLLVGIGFGVVSRYDDMYFTPIFWLVTFAIAPFVSVGCVVALWRQTGRPHWLAPLATLLVLPQLVVLFGTMMWLLHYLGLVG